uniref:Uncharacterized protein n=1 Tax=Kalanchoe fedtschenkoi TaxID=63787 RepID=A0A7N0T348_KALFE
MLKGCFCVGCLKTTWCSIWPENLMLCFMLMDSLISSSTSILNKIQSKAPEALSSHLYFKKVTAQLLFGAEEFKMKMD